MVRTLPIKFRKRLHHRTTMQSASVLLVRRKSLKENAVMVCLLGKPQEPYTATERRYSGATFQSLDCRLQTSHRPQASTWSRNNLVKIGLIFLHHYANDVFMEKQIKTRNMRGKEPFHTAMSQLRLLNLYETQLTRAVHSTARSDVSSRWCPCPPWRPILELVHTV